MAPIAVSLSIGVVLVDNNLLTIRHLPLCSCHGLQQNLFAGSVIQKCLSSINTFGRRELWVCMVNVVTRTVSEYCVHEMGLNLGCH